MELDHKSKYPGSQLESGWLWAATEWDASSWMEMENYKPFGIFLELHVIGLIGTSSSLERSSLLAFENMQGF